jgi:hypothetical protein
MNSKRAVIVVALAIALSTAACADDGQPSVSADDEFISELSSDPYWRTVDRATAITAARDFCDAATTANEQGRTGVDAVTMVATRYGLKQGPVLVGAARRSYCPDANLG